MRACAQDDAVPAQRGELRQAQTSLNGEQQKGVIATADPTAGIRCGQLRVNFWLDQEADQSARASLIGDRQHPLDLG